MVHAVFVAGRHFLHALRSSLCLKLCQNLFIDLFINCFGALKPYAVYIIPAKLLFRRKIVASTAVLCTREDISIRTIYNNNNDNIRTRDLRIIYSDFSIVPGNGGEFRKEKKEK